MRLVHPARGSTIPTSFPFRNQTPTFSDDFDSSSEQLAGGGMLFGPDAERLYAVRARGCARRLGHGPELMGAVGEAQI